MTTVLRYLAVVVLAITLTAVLAGTDELAGGNWPMEEGCSNRTMPFSVPPDAPNTSRQDKRTAGPGDARLRCAATSMQGAPATPENS